MSKKKIVGVVFLILIMAVSVMSANRQMDLRQTYYRGIYESCVWVSVVNNRTTSFDRLMCDELVQRAEKEHWYEHQVKFE